MYLKAKGGSRNAKVYPVCLAAFRLPPSAFRLPPSYSRIGAQLGPDPPVQLLYPIDCPGAPMNNIIYIVGLVVIVIAILSYLGLR
jgi:hypothetical protein